MQLILFGYHKDYLNWEKQLACTSTVKNCMINFLFNFIRFSENCDYFWLTSSLCSQNFRDHKFDKMNKI